MWKRCGMADDRYSVNQFRCLHTFAMEESGSRYLKLRREGLSKTYIDRYVVEHHLLRPEKPPRKVHVRLEECGCTGEDVASLAT